MKTKQQAETLTIWFNAQFKLGRTMRRLEIIDTLEKLGCKSFATNLLKVFKQKEFLGFIRTGREVAYVLPKGKHITQDVMLQMIIDAKEITNAPKNAYNKRKRDNQSITALVTMNKVEDTKPLEEPIIELTPIEETRSDSKVNSKDIIELLKGQLMTLRSQIELDKARLDLMERQLDTITNLLNK